MEYDSRTLSHSYTLLVAEDPASYAAATDRQYKFDSTQGQTLRLAMALVQGVSTTADDRQANADRLRTLTKHAAGRDTLFGEESVYAESLSDSALTDRLMRLVRANDRNLAEQLQLFLQIEERQLWRRAGCKDMLHWMDSVPGIGRVAGLERLRVARALRTLAVIEALFALGKLSWSKVRELTRVANPANEQALVAAALELSASETTHLCQRWRHDERLAKNGSRDGTGGPVGNGSGTGTSDSKHSRDHRPQPLLPDARMHSNPMAAGTSCRALVAR